jgi:hypothetical protein
MKSPVLARAVSTAILAMLALSPALASPHRTKTPRKTVSKTPSPTPTAAAPAPTAPPPRPATLVPDPPYVGTPPAGAASSYAGILHAKEAGATEAQLLELVAKEGKRYSLSTPDIQKLRAAGVSSRVIEAMLRSDRASLPAVTASAAPATTAAPAKSPPPR